MTLLHPQNYQGRNPSATTPGWLSLYAKNFCVFIAGIVVLRVISAAGGSQQE
jgi:hypothetical protein